MRLRTILVEYSPSDPLVKSVKDSTTLRFRSVGPTDVDILRELFESNLGSVVSKTFDPFPLTIEQAEKIALVPREDGYYLAFDQDRVVAMSMLRGFDEGYEIPSFGIFVDHEQHGRGIGRRLTVWTIEQAQALGCPSVRLSVYSQNSPAVRLYESLGFAEQSREPTERNGYMEEKIVMTLDLMS
jgi:[ribosomal protein S18]-alanine N-acetyltransferase